MRYVNARNTAYGEDRRTYKESDSGVSSTQRIFNVSYDNGRVEAYLNGVRLFPGEDYTKTSSGIGTSITLASDLGSNNVLEIVGYQGINSGNALVEDNFVVGTGSTGSGGSYTNSTTVFPVASSAGDTVSVWRNGIKLVPTTDYTVSVSAQTVTLGSAASSADEITVQVVGGAIHNNGLTVNSGNDSFFLPTTRGTDNYVLTRDDSAGTGGTTWKETLTPPSITNLTGEINEDTNTTLTVTGSGFSSGMTIKLINSNSGADITGHTALSYSGTSSPLTVTIPSATTNITAGTQVKLHISKQGLTTTSNAITVSEDPIWDSTFVSNKATFATIDDTLGSSQTVGTLNASAGAGGGTIVYASDDSSLDATYFSLASNGVITTTSTALTGLTGSANYTEAFNANAKVQGEETLKNTLLSGINIIVVKSPTGGTLGSYTGYRSHTFFYADNGESTNIFTLYEAKTVDVLLVGGGGGVSPNDRSAGAGAGAFVPLSSQSWPAGTYTMVAGVGGSNTSTLSNNDGGETSITYAGSGSFTNLIAKGGGAGGHTSTSNSSLDSTGKYGGSGGGQPISGSAGSGGSYGNDGGARDTTNSGNNVNSGGGGGAGGQGGNASSSQGGTGGAGSTNYWRDGDNTGTTAGIHVFAAGGGGGAFNNPGGTAGKVGSTVLGGVGGSSSVASGQGVDGTGSGGGGGGHSSTVPSRGGGHGVIILRYAI